MVMAELNGAHYLPAVPTASQYPLLRHPKIHNLLMKMGKTELKKWLDCTPDPVPVIVWHGFYIGDYAMYRLLVKRKRKVRIISWDKESLEEVICRICEQQLYRPALTYSWKMYLAATWVMTNSTIVDENGIHSSGIYKIAQKASRICGLNTMMIYRSKNYAEIVNAMYQRDPHFTRRMLDEKPKVSAHCMETLLTMSDRRYTSTREKMKTRAFVNQGTLEKLEAGMPLPVMQAGKKPMRQTNIKPVVSAGSETVNIKNMPKPDPDAYISSLALTIPSWVDTMTRAHKNTEYYTTSIAARANLNHQLASLEQAVSLIRGQIEEVNTNG